MKTHTTIINELVLEWGYTSYLEIGILDPTYNFFKIRALRRVGVDPDSEANPTHLMTSDDYFENHDEKFDLIFIDGLHHADQAYKDVLNALERLNEDGTIVLHDCSPPDENHQRVPRLQDNWTGDVWKAWVRLRVERDDLYMLVADTDYGVGIIRPTGTQKPIFLSADETKLTYELLNTKRKSILNLVPEDEYMQLLKENS